MEGNKDSEQKVSTINISFIIPDISVENQNIPFIYGNSSWKNSRCFMLRLFFQNSLVRGISTVFSIAKIRIPVDIRSATNPVLSAIFLFRNVNYFPNSQYLSVVYFY